MSKAAKYSTMAILLIPIGIAINYVGGQIALIL
ncbi:MAG: ECF transporter S component, partial [Firmicutes bacterium HGW-Firmicutes-20]